MKKFFIILLMFGLLYSISITSWETDKESYEPGDSGYVTLYISLTHNLKTGERLIRFNSVQLTTKSSFSDMDITLGDMDENEIAVTVPLKIGENIQEGVYAMVVKVTALAEIESGTSTKQRFDSASTTIPIKVVSKPALTLSIEPKTIGKRGEINIVVCNKRGNARNIEINSTLYIEGGKVFFNEVKDCSSKKVSYDASALSEGINNIVFTATYLDGIGQRYSEVFTIPLAVSKDATRFSISQEGTLITKESSTLILTLTNKGGNAEDIRVIPSSSIVLTKGSELEVGNIEKGQSKQVEAEVYTALTPGTTTIPFTIKWKEEGEEKEEVVNVPIIVEAKDSIDVYLEASPSPLQTGKEHTLSVVVANKASFDMSGVSVSIESNAFEVLEVEKRRFVGSLSSDDFSSQQFKIRVFEEVEKPYVKVTVIHKDPAGREKKEVMTIPITVKKSVKKEDSMIWIIAVIVVIGLLYYLYRRRK